MSFRIIPKVATFKNRQAARLLELSMAAPFEPLDGDRLRAMLLTCLVLVQAADEQRTLLIFGSPLPPAGEMDILERYYSEHIELHAAERLTGNQGEFNAVAWPQRGGL